MTLIHFLLSSLRKLLRISRWPLLLQLCLIAFISLLFCEFLIYRFVQHRCQLPVLTDNSRETEQITGMVIADTHLLGSRLGHWFDKLRREWQMERAFQTAMSFHNPNTVFVVGDLFDEGKWASDAEFNTDLSRFRKMFRLPDFTQLFVTIGNHDAGFHYELTPHKISRFDKAFNSRTVQMITHYGSILVFLNSMAFEGDGCFLCATAQEELLRVSHILNCSRLFFHTGNQDPGCTDDDIIEYSKPIVFQHFPLYRKSEAHCEGLDSAPDNIRNVRFKQKWDCISKQASRLILSLLNPRLVISGHSHFFCRTTHKPDIPEITVPSFSWRNIKQPSYLLLRASRFSFATEKCYMPNENTVYSIYFSSIFLGIALISWKCVLMPMFSSGSILGRYSSKLN